MSMFTIPKRSWPGFESWLSALLASVAVFELLALLAWRMEDGRVFDFTTAIITIPAGALLFVVTASFLWGVLTKTAFQDALGWSARLLPFFWAVPLIDLIRTFGSGIVIGPPQLSGVQVLQLIGTAGLLPVNSGISIGIRLGIFAGVLGIAVVTWAMTRSVWKTIVTGVVMSSVVIKSLLTLSLLAIWRMPFRADGWMALPFEVPRRAINEMSKGYWWDQLYQRFPTAIDGQAEIALRLVESATIVTALGLFLVAAYLVFQKARWSILHHVYRAWTTFDVGLYVGFGLIAVFSQGGLRPLGSGGSTCLLAGLLFLLLLIFLRFSMVLRRDLAQLEADERGQVNQPIVRGELSLESAKAYAKTGEWFALVAAWALGWPVFASVLVILACSYMTRHKFWSQQSHAVTIFRALGAGAIALLTVFVLSQDATVSELAIAVIIVAALHRFFIEWLWVPRLRKGVGSKG
ncbi:hypothetical protein GF380_06005 [Candidatus Uhrbacteria bacterium]|nr:hypothetical protein [Candidatus Uhrbacteria bacterium]